MEVTIFHEAASRARTSSRYKVIAGIKISEASEAGRKNIKEKDTKEKLHKV